MTHRATLILLAAVFATSRCFGVELASHADLVRIFRDEKFQLIHHVRQISTHDWLAAGVHPSGRSITALMVDPGKSYQDGDVVDTDKPLRQLLVGATNRHHEILSFWEGTQGGPMLCVLVLERAASKPRLIFSGIMNNDIDRDKWTWGELKAHVLQDRMDHLISADHPSVYDNRLP